jgi:molybdopterin converting factor small subunit
MTVRVRMTADLQSLSGSQRDVEACGTTVRDVIADLEDRHPGVSQRLLDDSGLRRYVNVYHGGTDVRFLRGLATEVPDGATLTILPATAGG